MFIYAILILLSATTLTVENTLRAQLGREMFDAMDSDRNGEISKSEAENYFLGYDADHDGVVTADEFTAAVDKLDPVFVGHEALLYNLFDHTLDMHVKTSDVDSAFNMVDTNSDSRISKTEFDSECEYNFSKGNWTVKFL